MHCTCNQIILTKETNESICDNHTTFSLYLYSLISCLCTDNVQCIMSTLTTVYYIILFLYAASYYPTLTPKRATSYRWFTSVRWSTQDTVMLICYLRELLRSAAKISSGLNSSLSFGVLIATVHLLTNLCETTEEINALTQLLRYFLKQRSTKNCAPNLNTKKSS